MNFEISLLIILIAGDFSSGTKLAHRIYPSHFYPRPQAKPFGYNPSFYISHIKSQAVKGRDTARNQISNQNTIVNSANSKILNLNSISNHNPAYFSSNYISNSNKISGSSGSNILNQNVVKNYFHPRTLRARSTQIKRVPLKKFQPVNANLSKKISFVAIKGQNS
ncbi:hypothetical protein BpHYR1_013200 [Brachionus plicatilis]|uniref:Uncharacterized protein n=1 Tax=Brachionus plicatilis TaxID=10195 RepID=A0A3M7QV99_BRAPC|nr:hypothetical protein BpHYR1_013200 [Brachionus plicatilis]